MRRMSVCVVSVASLGIGGAAFAVQPGHIQDFPIPGDLHGFSGGSQVYDNPGTGGVGGAGDGYLIVRNNTVGRLGTLSLNFEYFGDWITQGASGVSFYLQNGATPEALEIHFGIGNQNNFWQLSTGFIPTAQWTLHTVDFLTPSNWVRTHGSGTFQEALSAADRVHWRHDLAPYIPSPNAVAGDFALDRIMVLPAPGPLVLALGGLLVASRRRS